MPETKSVALKKTTSKPKVAVFFGGKEHVTYRVYLRETLTDYGVKLGGDDNKKTDKNDVFDVPMAAEDLEGWHIVVTSVFQDPDGGTVDSYLCRLSITTKRKHEVGSPVVWEGALNGQKHDSLVFPIQFS